MSIKWGVLGTAAIAAGCTIPGMKMVEDCELYAIAGRDEQKVKRYQEEFGFEKAYVGYENLLADEDVQAVYIPLPNHLHYEWVMKAIDAGKHVLCEKPLALNAEEAKKMFAHAKEKGVVLMEAYAYLHSPYVKALAEDVKSGIIGEVDYMESAFLTQGYEEDIRLYKEMGGGAMYDLGCYCTTMMLSLTDANPVFVKANAEMSDKGVDLLTAGILKFDNGIRASFNVGMMLGFKGARYDRLYIHGSEGVIISEVEYNQAGDLSYKIIKDEEVIVRKVQAPQNYSLEIQQMCNVVNGTESAYITPEFSIKNAELMDKVLLEIGY
ncbi:MAG: Gfo/Idh/MocA family oxidoreductase [Lachnospiraceae bacterium]|nr:Gfo/Idh/MocA family oxidoreductase [Lachnospiraceae bacterium]